MCKKITLTSMIKKKTRTKARKPKYLGLRLKLSPPEMSGGVADHDQLNLFPLHPENLVEDRDANDDNNSNVASYFFSFSSAAAATTTLTGILDHETKTTTTNSSTSDEENRTISLTCTYGRQDSGEKSAALARTALRNKERDVSEEEKWVCYSEVVERKDEEVCSNAAADLRYHPRHYYQDRHYDRTAQSLSLKLDYQEIMNAWSDKGPLCVHVESPQTVPDLLYDETTNHAGGGLWRVPEISELSNSSCCIKMINVNEEEGGAEEWKIKEQHREASVLRYKEKRQNRLFSKKIRYQVRKLNAEKRPRIKGRFVKRN